MKVFIIPFAIIVAVLFSTSNKACGSPGNTVDDFALKYKKAKTEAQRRAVCIEFIDAGLLYSGSPIDDVKAVFQKDFHYQGIDDQSNRLAIVRFVPLRPPSHPMASAIAVGWYLSLTYQQDGTVLHYCLSNESKETSMQLMYERQIKEHRPDTGTGLPSMQDIITNMNHSPGTN